MLLSIYPNELKTYIHTKSCMQMFISALFIIAKTWKQPKYTSVGEWSKCYSVFKRNELPSHKKIRRKLIYILLKWKKAIWECYILYDSNYMTSWKKQNYGDRRSVVARDSGGGIETRIGGAQGIFRAMKLFCMTL